MEPSALPYPIYILIEIIWLMPFFIISAELAYSQAEGGVIREFEARLRAANVFLFTAVAARLIAMTLKHNLRPGLPGVEIVMVVFALFFAVSLQVCGRLVSDYQLAIGPKLIKLLAVAGALLLSTAVVAAVSPLLDDLNIFKSLGKPSETASQIIPLSSKGGLDEEWVFKTDFSNGGKILKYSGQQAKKWVLSSKPQDARPLTAKELARSKMLLETIGQTYVPNKPYKRRRERILTEKAPIILEYPDVAPGDLLPKSDNHMVMVTITRLNKNMVAAALMPHVRLTDGDMNGKITVTALYSAKTAQRYFSRDFGARNVYIGGQLVSLTMDPGFLRAQWTKRRFAFEAHVEWTGHVDRTLLMDFLINIVTSTVDSQKLNLE